MLYDDVMISCNRTWRLNQIFNQPVALRIVDIHDSQLFIIVIATVIIMHGITIPYHHHMLYLSICYCVGMLI